MEHLTKRKIGFIGAGKVGTTLGLYFVKNGIEICGYYSKTYESSVSASELSRSKAFSSLKELITSCNLIFITIPDAAIGKVWEEICHLDISGHIIIHTSGSLTSKVFHEIDKKGAYGYSVHPMHAFAFKDGHIDGLKDACFTIEGDEPKFTAVVQFFQNFGNSIFTINAESKALYHLANVMASNLILGLIKCSTLCMEECGMKSEDALMALMPLIQVNISNLEKRGFAASLTGPVERNDVLTVEKHLKVIPGGFEALYRQLSLILVDIAKEKHPENNYEQLRNVITRKDEFENEKNSCDF